MTTREVAKLAGVKLSMHVAQTCLSDSANVLLSMDEAAPIRRRIHQAQALLADASNHLSMLKSQKGAR